MENETFRPSGSVIDISVGSQAEEQSIPIVVCPAAAGSFSHLYLFCGDNIFMIGSICHSDVHT